MYYGNIKYTFIIIYNSYKLIYEGKIMRFWTRFKLKLKKGFKRFIKRLFFTKDEWLRFKKTESYQMLRTIMIDRYFYKDITKNGYATVKAKKMNYRMEKEGIFTDARKEALLSKIFEKQHGYKINFNNPQTFNEKLMWMKLYYQEPLITKCCDKYAVKDYVANIVGEEYVVPTIKSWTNAGQINFDELPERFVLKVNWSSGYLKIVKNKEELNQAQTRRQFARWIKPYRNSYYQTLNWGYKNMPPIIFAEEYIEQENEQVYDYKFFCFNGRVDSLFIATDRQDKSKPTTFDFYDADFNPLPITYGGHAHVETPHKKPKNFEKMKEIAAKLSAPFPFVRVDFYDLGDRVYVGEMTFYSGGALLSFDPFEWDQKYGEMIHLPDKIIQDSKAYFEPMTPKEAYMMESRITPHMQRMYCVQKAYAQLGYLPDLDNPKSFNEKIIWLALNYKNPDIRIAADKYRAKEYISARVGEQYVVPLIGAYDDISQVDFSALPKKFVAKSNSGWGSDQVILVTDKDTYCVDYLKVMMSTWLYPWCTYYYQNMCITDEKIEPKIVIEELLEAEEGGSVDDYKFYCCGGEPRFALVVSDRKKAQTRTFVDMNWEPIPVMRKGKNTAAHPKCPTKLDEMISLCRILAKDFPLVRIDFYEVDGRVYVGELTFTPGMFLGFKPIEMDFKLGEYIDLSKYM